MRAAMISIIIACGIAVGIANADIKDGLVAHFPFDEGKGTVAGDGSGHGLKGKVHGAHWIKRADGAALEFDGKAAYVDCGPGKALGLKDQLTLSAWILPKAKPGKDEPMIIGEEPNYYALTYYYKNRNVYFYAAGTAHALTVPVRLGVTAHIAGTFDGKTMKLYLNGRLRGSRDVGKEVAISSSLNFVMGGFRRFNAFFRGVIADVRVYNRALPADEIMTLSTGHLPNYLSEGATFELADLPDGPQRRDPHTLLLANFDRDNTNDADYALFDPVADAGVGSKKVPGKFGKAVALAGGLRHYGPYRFSTGNIIYNGHANVNMSRGTLEFWIRSAKGANLWTDQGRHLFVHVAMSRSPEFAGRPRFEMVLEKTETGLVQFAAVPSVKNTKPVLVPGIEEPPAGQGVLCLPAAKLAPEEWHHLLIAWDVKDGGRLWLAVDGKGVTSSFNVRVKPGRPRPATWVRIGGKLLRTGGKAGGVVLDDLKITNAPISLRIKGAERPPSAAIDEKRLIREEDAVRRWLDLMIRLQTGGGWYEDYTIRSWRPAAVVPQGTIKNSDFFSPGQVGSVFLRAYEMFDDERYLNVARKTGEMFLRVQHPDGHFDGYFYSTPMGVKPDALSYAAIEEVKQHSPLWFLVHLHAVTGDERYMNAAKKVADFLLQAQNKDGSWPWGYDLKTRTAKGAHATFNDMAIKWSAQDMFFMYQVTGEKRYLDSFFRCVEWVISAQLPPPTYGWAEQYNEKNEACWARGFEPPALAGESTRDAILILQLAYDITGNRRYLEPIKKYWDWAKTVNPGEHGFYHDIKTGRRIAALNNKIYFLGTKEWDENYKNFLVWRGWERPVILPFLEKNDGLRKNGPAFRALLTRRWHPRSRFAELAPTREQLARFAQTYQGYKSRTAGKGWADKVLEMNESLNTGAWWAGARNRHGEEYFSAGDRWMHIFLSRILAARIALGDMPISRFPRYDPEMEDAIFRFFWVQPDRDWYEIKNKKDLPKQQ